jgi:hypothetical protein
LCVVFRGKPTHHLIAPEADGTLKCNKKSYGCNTKDIHMVRKFVHCNQQQMRASPVSGWRQGRSNTRQYIDNVKCVSSQSFCLHHHHLVLTLMSHPHRSLQLIAHLSNPPTGSGWPVPLKMEYASSAESSPPSTAGNTPAGSITSKVCTTATKRTTCTRHQRNSITARACATRALAAARSFIHHVTRTHAHAYAHTSTRSKMRFVANLETSQQCFVQPRGRNSNP